MSLASRTEAASVKLAAIVLLALLAGCESRDRNLPNPQVLIDESVSLERRTLIDVATRIVEVPAGTVIVAQVDERGTDVRLRVRAGKSMEQVESTLQGESIEIASIEVAESGKVFIELEGPHGSARPGTVRLRVESFRKSGRSTPAARALLAVYADWTVATRLESKDDPLRQSAFAGIGRAIAALETAELADARLAATARLVRASLLYVYEVDWREARLEAQRAARAFAAPAVADALNAARARRLEAAALQEMAADRRSENPTSDEARVEALRIYSELIADGSPLDAVGRGRVLNFRGLMEIDVQEWRSAEESFHAAMRLYDSAGFNSGRLQVFRNLAFLEDSRGNYAGATQRYAEALREIDSLSDWDGRATLLHNSATTDVNAGETDRAIARFSEAFDLAKQHGLVPARARALHGLGVSYWARGELTLAKTFFEQALTVQQQLDDGPGTFAMLRSMGAFMREYGDPGGALALHEDALTHASSPMRKLRAHIEIARDHAALGELAEALRSYRTAQTIPFENPDHPVQREAQLLLAEILVMNPARSAAETAEADRVARASLGRTASMADYQMEIVARRVLARLLATRGHRSRALDELQRAIDLVQKYSLTSTNPELQASTRASQARLYRDYVELRMAGAANGADQARALQVLETVRAQNFDPGISSRLNAGSTDKLRALLDQLTAKKVRLAAARERSRPSEGEIASLQTDMLEIRAQIDRLRGSSDSKQRTTPPVHEPPAEAARWRKLAPHAAQLSFFLADANAYLWRRDENGVRAWTLPASGDAIRREIAMIAGIDSVQSPREYERAVSKLSGLLLPPDAVTGNHSSVSIVADGELSLVPFAALASPVNPDRRFGETHVITRSPALVLTIQRSQPSATRRWKLLALDGSERESDSTTTRAALFRALPGAKAETDAVVTEFGEAGPDSRTRVLRGDDANVAMIRETMEQGVDVMHFATHALVDLQQPLASLLWLPTPASSEQRHFLSAGQIQEWQGDAELVFLNACESAVGPARFAEEMPGLQRAFLRGGAQHVIATLRPIEDEFARQFALQFYSELTRGNAPPVALALTQRAWLSSAKGESEQKQLRRRLAALAYVLYSR